MTSWGQGEGESVPRSLPDVVTLTPVSPRWGGHAAATGLEDTQCPQLGPSAAWGQGQEEARPQGAGGGQGTLNPTATGDPLHTGKGLGDALALTLLPLEPKARGDVGGGTCCGSHSPMAVLVPSVPPTHRASLGAHLCVLTHTG